MSSCALQKGTNRQVKKRIQIYWSRHLGPRRQIQIDGSKETDPKRRIQIDMFKKMGQNRLVQEDRIVQIHPNWSNMVQNQTKKCPNGFGITRSPGLVSSSFEYLNILSFKLWTVPCVGLS